MGRRWTALVLVAGLGCSLSACSQNGPRALAAEETLPAQVALADLPVFGAATPWQPPADAGDEADAGTDTAPAGSAEPSAGTDPGQVTTIDGPAQVGTDASAERAEELPRRASFAFTGDTLLHSPLVNAAAGPNGCDFSSMFDRVSSTISAADLAICHLETPIAPPGEALSTYPLYGVPAAIATDLAEAGYDRCSTASNHTIDRGLAGVDATVDALTAAGVSQAGMARTPEESVVPIIEVNGIKIAHLSFTANFNGNWLAADQSWRSPLISADAVIGAAADARARGAEVVVVSLHWGTERVATPDGMQRSVADAVMASGTVDLIVGHHAHVIQPIELVHGRWVIYGLGNFLSNMPTGDTWPASTQDGVIVTTAVVEQPDGSFQFETPISVPTWVDRDNGWVIRPVLADLADPSVGDGVKSRLQQSLARTQGVIGAFVAA